MKENLVVYNTMTKQKEPFIPHKKDEVGMYVCGPTTYNYIHLGNARPIVVFDTIRRYLEYSGYKVTYIQNFTDVDDKIIKRANEEGDEPLRLAARYIDEFYKDTKSLNILPATKNPKVSEHIDDIIDFVQGLIDKGYAYELDGDVYFSVRKDKNYGKLSGRDLDDLQSGARVEVDNRKQDPLDFALWKSAKPGEPYWESPWGKGRPGWHIECSAMSLKYLGTEFDIHGGGQDLIFPHHENEIAQGECCTGKEYAHYWMHNGYINVDNVKMSKSKGNFFTTRDVAEKYGYETIKLMMVQSHYRSPFNYTLEVIESCKNSLDRLYNCREKLEFALDNGLEEATEGEAEFLQKFAAAQEKFVAAMDDDLNTADGLTALFDLTRDINTALQVPRSKALAQKAAEQFDAIADVLGILYNRKKETLDADIEALIEKRQAARKAKDFKTADAIRDQLAGMGITLKDTPQGVQWTRA